MTPLSILLGYITVLGVSKTLVMTGLFENLKMFYPPEGGGRLLGSILRGPIVFNIGVIGVVKGVWGFKNTGDDRPF